MVKKVYIEAFKRECIASMMIENTNTEDAFAVLIKEIKKLYNVDISDWDYITTDEEDPMFLKFQLGEKKLYWFGGYSYDISSFFLHPLEKKDAELYEN